VAKERVWVRGEAVLGVGQWGAECGVECVGVRGVGVEWVSGVGRVDGWGALGGGPCVRWSFRDVLWSVRCGLLGEGIDGVLCGAGVDMAEALKNGGVGRCWDVGVVLSWLQSFRL
jgi:hypothetical protein